MQCSGIFNFVPFRYIDLLFCSSIEGAWVHKFKDVTLPFTCVPRPCFYVLFPVFFFFSLFSQANLYAALLKTLSTNNQGFSGRTWANNHKQYTGTSKLHSCTDYPNQKTTIKPNESSFNALKRGRSLE